MVKASPAGQKKRPTPISITSTPAASEHNTPQSGVPPIVSCVYVATRRKPSSPLSTGTPQQPTEKPDTQTSSEYIPSQNLPTQRTESPTLRKVTPKKRKLSSFNPVLESKSSSSVSVSRAPSEKQVSSEAANDHSVTQKQSPKEPARVFKKRKLVRKVIEDSQLEVRKSIPPVEGAPIDVYPQPSSPTVKPVQPLTPKPPSQQSPKSQTSQRKETRSRPRSRQLTPSQALPKSRLRSLSPVTKIDSWISFDSDNFEDEIPQTELGLDHLHSGTLSQIHDPPTLQSEENMNPIPPGQTGPGFTPIQVTQHRLNLGQNVVVGQSGQRPGSSHPLAKLV